MNIQSQISIFDCFCRSGTKSGNLCIVLLEIREILEPYDGFERWLECVRRGTRCHNDGTCLLVDYQVSGESNPRTHLYGHGYYTQVRTMLFHHSQIVSQFYSR